MTGPKKYESSLLNGEVYFCLHPSWQANLPGSGVQRLCFQVFDPYPIIDTLGVQSYMFLFVTHLPALNEGLPGLLNCQGALS